MRTREEIDAVKRKSNPNDIFLELLFDIRDLLETVKDNKPKVTGYDNQALREEWKSITKPMSTSEEADWWLQKFTTTAIKGERNRIIAEIRNEEREKIMKKLEPIIKEAKRSEMNGVQWTVNAAWLIHQLENI